MFVGLVKDPGWRPPPPGDQPEPARDRSWQMPWRALAKAAVWIATVIGIFLLVPVAEHLVGPLAGYVLILSGVALGVWRIDRWCFKGEMRGLRDFQA